MIIRWCFMVGSGRLVVVNRRDSLLAALVATIWGFNFVVIDWGMHDVPPLLFAAIRFAAGRLPGGAPRPPPGRAVAGAGRRSASSCRWASSGFLYLVDGRRHAAGAGRPRAPGPGHLHGRDRRRRAARAADRGRRSPAWCSARSAWSSSAFGRGGHVTAAALALCLLAALSWGIGNVVSRASGVDRRPVADRLVGGRGARPAVRAVARCSTAPRVVGGACGASPGRPSLSTLYTAGLASLVGLRDLQLPALPQRRRRRSCRGCCSRRSSRWRRPGCCSASSPTPPRPIGGRC